jgi:hypothetical protein
MDETICKRKLYMCMSVIPHVIDQKKRNQNQTTKNYEYNDVNILMRE